MAGLGSSEAGLGPRLHCDRTRMHTDANKTHPTQCKSSQPPHPKPLKGLNRVIVVL